ncbi:MAG: hypothetical protein ABI643_02865 [Candidatus Doudnabacteria bacterium]
MLAQLLSSKPKTNLINLLLAHPQRSFSETELKASSDCPNKLLKETLKELIRMDFLSITQKNRVKYYQMNRNFPLYPELLNLLRKVKKIPADLLSKAASKMGDCRLVILTGVFVGKPRVETDVLFVGKVSPKKLQGFLKQAGKFAQQQISYTVFTVHEFEYRKVMSDRFVKNILENNPVIVIDKLKNRNLSKIAHKF